MFLGVLKNARFLDVGTNRVVVGGTTQGFTNKPDGQTFYTDPVDEIDGNIVRCGEQTFRIERNLMNV